MRVLGYKRWPRVQWKLTFIPQKIYKLLQFRSEFCVLVCSLGATVAMQKWTQNPHLRSLSWTRNKNFGRIILSLVPIFAYRTREHTENKNVHFQIQSPVNTVGFNGNYFQTFSKFMMKSSTGRGRSVVIK